MYNIPYCLAAQCHQPTPLILIFANSAIYCRGGAAAGNRTKSQEWLRFPVPVSGAHFLRVGGGVGEPIFPLTPHIGEQ